MKEPTVYVVDDDEAVRDSIKELVESVDLKAETFSSAQSFLESYTPDQSGCLVLDVRMAKMSGLALQARLREVGATLPIIFVSGHGDINMAVGVMKAGAVDFIQKPYHEQSLLESIHSALKLDVQNRDKSQNKDTWEQYVAVLTPREREVMELLLQGHANKAIADRLSVSPRTVEVHRRHVLEKYKVKSVMQLMHILQQTAS